MSAPWMITVGRVAWHPRFDRRRGGEAVRSGVERLATAVETSSQSIVKK